MWLLETDSDSQSKRQHRFLLGVEFTVGRKGCNLNLDDRSVSRKHAILIATMPEASSSVNQPTLHLKDISSFGTRINKKKAEHNVLTPLQDGDKIIFGSPKSTYLIRFSPLVVTSSCLDKSLKVDLERTLNILGGKIVAEWSPSCTHLVMQNLSITVKVICALAAQRTVVTINYFKTLIESIKNPAIPFPEESNFLPKVSDSLAVRHVSTFQTNLRRKTLFNGKTFIFLNASQMKKMQQAINLTDGNVKLFLEKNDRISDEELTLEGNLVMSPPSCGINTQWLSHIQAVLESYGKRMISDAEIGHAVLSCSIHQYCNPDFDLGKTLDPLASQTMQTQTQNVLNSSSTQSSMSLILNKPSNDKSNDSILDTKPSTSHQEISNLSNKIANSTKNDAIDSKKRRFSSLEEDEMEKDINKQIPSKKQCVFKVPVLNEYHDSNRKLSSSMLICDTDSEKTMTISKPTLVVADSNPDDVELRDTIDLFKSDKPEDPEPNSKNDYDFLLKKNASVKDDENSPEKNLNFAPEVLVQDTPSASGHLVLEKKNSSFLVEDSEAADCATGLSNKETHIKVKEEVIDSAFDNAIQETKLFVPESQVTKKESQITESSETNDIKRTRHQIVADVNLAEGFITTRLPIKQQVTKIKKEEDLEEKELPSACIETIFTNLVTNRSSRLARCPDVVNRNEETPAGYQFYRGKLVRNFKKFKKNALPGGFSLPRIIGGSDLVVHIASRNKEIDEWMRQNKEQESQQNEDERRAEELFNWDSRSKGKRIY